MCMQVFPCPRQPTRGGRYSAPGRTNYGNHQNTYNDVSSLSLERSSKLEDSSTSCTTSFSDQSVHSTASDTLLVCRKNRSVPLDVPLSNNGFSSNIPNFSTVGDSGFCGEQSYGSISSGPQSFPAGDSVRGNITYSCGSLYKRWLRSTSTSLEQSTSSLTGSASADECYIKPHPRTRKLGLAIIIQLTNGQEENLQKFLLEHAALIEAMVWRVRHGSELAFLRHVNFLSLMSEVTVQTSRWLIAFLTGPHLSLHMWQTLSANCDITASINSRTFKDRYSVGGDCHDLTESMIHEHLDTCVSAGSLTNSLESTVVGSVEKTEYAFLNLSRFFRSDCDVKKSDYNSVSVGSSNRSFLAEKFVRQLCELLESVDVKHTNFFISTLVTAVLTHHLGWVTTVLDSNADDQEAMRKLAKTSNPLWGQLNDLYGAVGCPTKMAHTVITGSNKPELITKMLNSLTYFIRCNDVEKKSASRLDVEEENSVADRICKEECCIPKENYKKYQDHLKEIAATNTNAKDFGNIEETKVDLKLNSTKINQFMSFSELKKLDEDQIVEPAKEDVGTIKLSRGLTKATTCLANLSKMVDVANEDSNEENIPNNTLSRANSNTLNASPSTPKEEHFGLTNEDINRKVQTLFRGLKEIPSHRSHQDMQQLEKVDLEKQRSSSVSTKEKVKGVVFVLGDNEELVGLKKSNSQVKLESNVDKFEEKTGENSYENIPNKNNSSLSDSTEQPGDLINSGFKDSDFVKYKSNFDLKPSTSWTHLDDDKNNQAACSTSSGKDEKKKSFLRAKSEPPEHAKTNTDASTKPRFRYTGVKFNFQQHPQIFTNYMRSKNIELSNLSFAEKAMKFNGALSTNFDFSNYEDNFEEVESLQTPSNASELEFTSEMGQCKSNAQNVQESPERLHKTYKRTTLPNTIIKEPSLEKIEDVETAERKSENLTSTTTEKTNQIKSLKLIELPMPKSVSTSTLHIGYTSSLFRGIGECYTSDMVLQGISVPKSIWEASLRKDLTLTARHPLLDQPIDEAVAIVADTDTWEVQLMSSHTYVIDKGTSGVRIGMSQLVANMLESLLHMWKLHTPPEYCIMHIEQRLQEFCTRSKALAQMLLATDFCSMELLTTSLQLEVNDIPLLMAVASTHSPQITQKYGLSFQ